MVNHCYYIQIIFILYTFMYLQCICVYIYIYTLAYVKFIPLSLWFMSVCY